MDRVPFRISSLDGSLLKEKAVFDYSVRIGRSAANEQPPDIEVKPSFRAVSRSHASIVANENGNYELIPVAGRACEINGRIVENRSILQDGAEIRLGGENGIRLKFELLPHNENLADPHKTLPQKLKLAATSLTAVLGDVTATKIILTQMRAALLIGGIVLVILTLWMFQIDWRTRNVEQELIAQQNAEKAEATNGFSEQVRDQLLASTYLIAVEGSRDGPPPRATAWALDERTLVTNAHVARIWSELAPDEKLVAVRASTGEKWLIKGPPVFHPAESAFEKFMSEEMPGVADHESGFRELQRTGAYDLALLVVQEGKPLPARLEPATPEELERLRPGSLLAYAGFPLEDIRFSENWLKPNPSFHFGYVTALSDFFGLPQEDAETELIQHSLPATGGASGSAIINPQGRVVGVLSAGNIILLPDGKRIPSAVQINFGQRIDLLASIRADEATLAMFRARWEKSASLFTERRQAYLALLDRTGRLLFGAEPSCGEDGCMLRPDEKSRNGEFETRTYRISSPGSRGFGVFIQGSNGEPINVLYLNGNAPARLEGRPVRQPDLQIAYFQASENDELTIMVQSRPLADGEIEIQLKLFM